MHLDLTAMPEPESLDDVRAELMLLRHAVEGLRCELVRQRLIGAPPAPPPAVKSTRERDEGIIALAAEIGLGRTWPAAGRIAELWSGAAQPVEPEIVRLVATLQAWPALSQRQVWRVLSDN